MPLAGRPDTDNPKRQTMADATAAKADATLKGLKDRAQENQQDRFAGLPSTTKTVGFRVPRSEVPRLRTIFGRQGLKLSEGLKKAVYEYLEMKGWK